MASAPWSEAGAAHDAAQGLWNNINDLSGFGEGLYAILTNDTSANSAGLTTIINTFLENVKTSLMVPLQGVGVALALLFLIVSIYQLAMEDRMSPEVFVKHFGKFGLSMIFIMICPTIVDYILAFSNALANYAMHMTIGGGTSSIPSVTEIEATYLQAEELDMVSSWSLFFNNILSGTLFKIACAALTCVGYIVGFSRIIELSIRELSLPIAMGLLTDDGWRGAGGNYIRKFLAICCQSFILIVIAKITTTLMLTSSVEGYNQLKAAVDAGALPTGKSVDSMLWSGMVLALGAGVASVTIMFKSINIVNDIFGAH